MKSRGSRHVEEPSLDAIRRFQIMLDTDDESEYKVVSSTQQRLDLLLSSPDEVIDVSKPSRMKKEINEYPTATTSFTQRIEENGFRLALLLAFFILYYYIRKHGKRQHTAKVKTKSPNAETKENNISDSTSSDAQKPRLQKAVSFEERTCERDSFVERRDQEVVREGEVPPLRAEDSHTPQQDLLVMGETTTTIVAIPANAALGSNAASLPPVLIESNDTSKTDSDNDSKIQLFTNMARDIKLAEDILADNGVERSLAQQLAVSMKTSEAVMGSQRQLETQRMMMDTHQRHLDRQLSQRQHEESLHASKYDPNWNEKLEQKRDLCWSATTRIVLEVLVIHYLSRILKPIMDSFSSSQSHFPIQELGRLAIYAICDCGSSTNEIMSSPVTTALFSTPRALAIILNYIGLDYLLAIDAGLCYCHCLLSFGGTILLAIGIHQGLRIVAAPSLLHQIVNITGLAFLFGGPNLWQSQYIISMEALVSFSKLHVLGIGLLCIFAMVQWNYSNCRQRVHRACKSPTAFPESFATSIQQLDTLYTQLCFFRYAMVAIFCATHFSRGS